MNKELIDTFMKAAQKWFDETFEPEFLKRMEDQGLIAQPLGFRLGCLANLRMDVETEFEMSAGGIPLSLAPSAEAMDDYIADQVNQQNYEVVPKNSDMVKELCIRLFRRRKIVTAVKIHRYHYGVSILESKAAVEGWAASRAGDV